jgi:FMN-dependent NADH-azoreductase
MLQALRFSDELVEEILQADHIAIGTPVYNYNVPAVLKAWIDHIVRKGKTLGYAGEGLVHDKLCTILMASGGVYTDGSPLQKRDIATRYLRLILKVIGIEDIVVVAGGNAKAVDTNQIPREEFLAGFSAQIAMAAGRDRSLHQPG